jgi:tRNA-dihydrouridine synthase B
MTLAIGPMQISDPVLLAPMSGVSDLPFRRLVSSFGVGLLFTEMVASKIIQKQSAKMLGIARTAPNDPPTVVQLLGRDSALMGDAALLCQDLGASMIDINLGCPARKVVGGAAGSALMRDKALVQKIISSVVAAVNIPVSIKMRTGWDMKTRNAPELAKLAEDCGVKMITVHGRTRCQFYNGNADWEFIGEVVDTVSIPVIGNGDISTVMDAKKMLRVSGCSGVMVGRGCQGKPWFPSHIIHYLRTGAHLAEPSHQTKIKAIFRHLDEMLTFYGLDRGMRIARKHLGWYGRVLLLSEKTRKLILQASNTKTIYSLLETAIEEDQNLPRVTVT